MMVLVGQGWDEIPGPGSKRAHSNRPGRNVVAWSMICIFPSIILAYTQYVMPHLANCLGPDSATQQWGGLEVEASSRKGMPQKSEPKEGLYLGLAERFRAHVAFRVFRTGEALQKATLLKSPTGVCGRVQAFEHGSLMMAVDTALPKNQVSFRGGFILIEQADAGGSHALVPLMSCEVLSVTGPAQIQLRATPVLPCLQTAGMHREQLGMRF